MDETSKQKAQKLESKRELPETRPTKSEQIGVVLTSLDQFALQTSLPRPWHAEWQTRFNQVRIEVQAILNQKDSKDARTS